MLTILVSLRDHRRGIGLKTGEARWPVSCTTAVHEQNLDKTAKAQRTANWTAKTTGKRVEPRATSVASTDLLRGDDDDIVENRVAGAVIQA